MKKAKKISFKIDKKTIRNTKSFVFRGKNYPFDFELFKQNSNYFYNNRQFLENVDLINIVNEEEENIIDISKETIKNFIKCCQEESIDIDISNAIQLQFLAYKYDVPQLIMITTNFITENNKDLLVKSLLFKTQIQNDDDKKLKFLDTSNEELIISSNLNKYIDDDQLLDLPISVLERIISKFLFQSNSEKNQKNSDKIIDFLFSCLDKHGKDASILFSFIDFEHQSIDVFNRLLNGYSDIFDFNMINSTLLKTTSQLTSELTKLKLEFSTELTKMKTLFEDQQKELKKIAMDQIKKNKNEDAKSREREENFEIELSKLKNERKKQKDIFDESLLEMKKKQEDIVKSETILKYHEIIKEIINVDNFNGLKNESKKFIINEIIKNSPKIEDVNTNNIERLVLLFKNLFELAFEKNKKSKIDEIDFIIENIKNTQKSALNCNQIEILYQKKALKSFINSFTDCFKDITIEIKYPSENFDEIYNIVYTKSNDLQKYDDDENNNSNITANNISKIKINLYISDIDSIDQKFRNNKIINKCKFGSNVKSINDEAFYQCENLSCVEFSSSITKIGNSSFYGCSSLKEIKIPSKVASIGSNAFYGCSKLKEIAIPSSVSTIGSSAFCNCSSLRKVSIPSSVTSFGSSIFSGCNNINEIEYDPNQTSITNILNNTSSLVKLIISSTNATIYNLKLSQFSNLNEVVISSSITTIGDSAFSDCYNLKQIKIPSSVTSIEPYAFYNCSSLNKISIPPSVTYFGEEIFEECYINEIECDPSQTDIGSFLSNSSSITKLIIYPTVTTLSNLNLNRFNNLNEIVIPSSVTVIGDYAFNKCNKLNKIIIPLSVKTIGNYAFNYCKSLADVTIPSSVTSIGEYAFNYCSSLKQIEIPNSVKSIGKCAFYNCSSLKKITVPSALQSQTFSNNSKVKVVIT